MPLVGIQAPAPGARGRVASPEGDGASVGRSEGTERRRSFSWPAAVTLSLVFTLAPARPAGAQTVQGTVLDAASSLPIFTAEVALLATDDSIAGRYITDTNGWFVGRVPDAGSYRIRATRIGYASFTTDTFVVVPGQVAVVELRLQPSPTPLDPLEVVVGGRSPRLVRVGFYSRRAKGFGYFRTPEDLEDLQPVFPEQLFYGMSGVRMLSDGTVVSLSYSSLSSNSPCPLTVAVDGHLLQDASWTELVHVNDIEAIEVYPRPNGVPVWLSGTVSPCGAIVIWLKGSLR
jgi:hypothetical protein